VPVNTTMPQRLYSGGNERRYVSIYNTGDSTLYVDAQPNPSKQSNFIPIVANAYYESPHALEPFEQWWGIWDAAATAGQAQVKSWLGP
jgi:hypothetical protein